MDASYSNETMRKKFVFSFFALFALFLCLSLLCILFLFNANIVSMDQSQALSDLRLVTMYLDNRYPEDWTLKDGYLYKGENRVSGNHQIATELARYIRPDTRLSFHVGETPGNIETIAFSGTDFLMRLVLSLKKDDHRLESDPPGIGQAFKPGMKIGSPDPPPGMSGTPPPMPFDNTFQVPGGILHIIKSVDEKPLGWIQLERESLGQGSMENWVFFIFLVASLILSSVILYIAYRIIFKLSEPVHRLLKRHAEVTVAKESLEDISRRDPLTGLLNRRGFDMAFSEFEFPSDGSYAAAAIIDLDNFKKINDTHGHACGDYVLKEVSHLIASGVRQGDIACRWGGEEFLVFYSGAEDASLMEIAHRICHSIADHSYKFEGYTLIITATIGFSPCKGASDFIACTHRADAALYRGKNEGKNRVVRG